MEGSHPERMWSSEDKTIRSVSSVFMQWMGSIIIKILLPMTDLYSWCELVLITSVFQITFIWVLHFINTFGFIKSGVCSLRYHSYATYKKPRSSDTWNTECLNHMYNHRAVSRTVCSTIVIEGNSWRSFIFSLVFRPIFPSINIALLCSAAVWLVVCSTSCLSWCFFLSMIYRLSSAPCMPSLSMLMGYGRVIVLCI